MAEGRERVAWNHTAALLAAVCNLFAEKPVGPDCFHPYRDGAADAGPTEAEAEMGWALLKAATLQGAIK